MSDISRAGLKLLPLLYYVQIKILEHKYKFWFTQLLYKRIILLKNTDATEACHNINTVNWDTGH